MNLNYFVFVFDLIYLLLNKEKSYKKIKIQFYRKSMVYAMSLSFKSMYLYPISVKKTCQIEKKLVFNFLYFYIYLNNDDNVDIFK